MNRPWTEAHRREALRRTYEIAAELTAADRAADATWLVEGGGGYAENENDWRFDLGDTPGPGLDPVRIDREVRRVRALAEGRLVREQTSTRFYVSQPGSLDEDFGTHSGAKLAASQRRSARAHCVKVTRIRRAT